MIYINGINVYFVTTGLREEVEAIKRVKPPRLLCSYWYFKNKPLFRFVADLGYTPEIMLDSGAYSAFTKGKNVSILDYLKYIEENAEHISRYVALDVIGDAYTTKVFFEVMRHKGFSPIPVFHYGDDLGLMHYYLCNGSGIVALGNTVGIQDKETVARWCADLHERFPNVSLHLLGSSSTKIMRCGAVDSCDASTWYMRAINGHPRHISGKTKEAKINRAVFNMKKIMEESGECKSFSTWHQSP